MTTKFTITDATRSAKNGTALDYNGGRWVKGRIGEYVYDAKVYACGSRFGIHEGNISKLSIRHAATHKEVAAYDRGWVILPENEFVTEMVDALADHYYAE